MTRETSELVFRDIYIDGPDVTDKAHHRAVVGRLVTCLGMWRSTVGDNGPQTANYHGLTIASASSNQVTITHHVPERTTTYDFDSDREEGTELSVSIESSNGQPVEDKGIYVHFEDASRLMFDAALASQS